MLLSHDDIRKAAPSVFSREASPSVSSRYRYFSTFDVVKELEKIGFGVSDARQTKVRLPDKKEFAKHLLRFRPTDKGLVRVGDMVPEVILTNAHDGTASYRAHAGVFRFVCENGLIVADSSFGQVAVKHTGDEDLVEQVVQATVKIGEGLTELMDRVQGWPEIQLPWERQLAFAERAIKEAAPSSLSLDPEDVLLFRRAEDRWGKDRTRDLWRTLNVVQENLIRGGVSGKDADGKSRQTRSISAVDRIIGTNKALWAVAEDFVEA